MLRSIKMSTSIMPEIRICQETFLSNFSWKWSTVSYMIQNFTANILLQNIKPSMIAGHSKNYSHIEERLKTQFL